MVRPTLPRFLNYGDKEVGVTTIIQNQTDQLINVNLIAKSYNLELINSNGFISDTLGITGITIQPNLRTEVKFKVTLPLLININITNN